MRLDELRLRRRDGWRLRRRDEWRLGGMRRRLRRLECGRRWFQLAASAAARWARSMGGGGGSADAGAVTASSGGSGGKSPDFENPVSMTADPATNSLMVSAAPQDYRDPAIRHRRTRYSAHPGLRAGDHRRGQRRADQRHRRQLPIRHRISQQHARGRASSISAQLQTALGNPLGLTGLGLGLASGSNCTISTAERRRRPAATGATSTTTTTVPVRRRADDGACRLIPIATCCRRRPC